MTTDKCQHCNNQALYQMDYIPNVGVRTEIRVCRDHFYTATIQGETAKLRDISRQDTEIIRRGFEPAIYQRP